MCNASLSRRSVVGMIAAVPAVCLLDACGPDENSANEPAVPIEKGDTCAACGMYITRPGPRGEAYLAGVKGVLKFGSTRDFFAYINRSDIASRLEKLYVQDTAAIDWEYPSNAAKTFIDARTAYYVAWQPLPGQMGPTFAPFAKRADAEAFIRAHGGAILRFDQITPALVSGLTYTCPAEGSPLHALAAKAKCVAKAG